MKKPETINNIGQLFCDDDCIWRQLYNAEDYSFVALTDMYD